MSTFLSISLTPNHMIFRYNNGIKEIIPSKNLKIGDVIMTFDGPEVIENIKEFNQHPISPQLLSGTVSKRCLQNASLDLDPVRHVF